MNFWSKKNRSHRQGLSRIGSLGGKKNSTVFDPRLRSFFSVSERENVPPITYLIGSDAMAMLMCKVVSTRDMGILKFQGSSFT